MIKILNGIHETIQYEDLPQVRLYHNVESENYPSHWHVGIEVIIPVENYYTVVVGNERIVLQENDIIIINTGIIHGLEAPATGRRIILQFNIALLNILKEFETLLFMMPSMMIFRAKENTEIYRIIYEKFLTLIKEYDENKAFNEAFIYAKLIEIYGELARCEVYRKERLGESAQAKQQNYIEAVLRTCEYINNHYMEKLKLEQVAMISGFSKYHFTRIFKQFMDMTFYEYLNQRRIKRATLLLSNQEMSITEVALEAGFTSISTFNRTFKEINGRSPSSYREKEDIYTWKKCEHNL
jgi:AraC-type DNA-binding domain-containing proteins